MQVPPLGQEDPLEEEMAAYSGIFAWKNLMDRVAWQVTIHGVTQSQTWLSMHAQTAPFKMKNTSTELNTILVEFHPLEYPNFLLWLSYKNPPAITGNAKRDRFNPGLGKMPWSRKWQPTSVLAGIVYGQGKLVGFSPWDCKKWGTTEGLRIYTWVCNALALQISRNANPWYSGIKAVGERI